MSNLMTKQHNLDSKRVAVHLSPALIKSTVPQAEILVNDALVDAFLGKITVVTQQPDDRVEDINTNPHWEEQFRELALENARTLLQNQRKQKLFVTQYQLDSQTLVSCLNVESSLSFDAAFHYAPTERDLNSDFQPRSSETFVGFTHEDTTPPMKTWDDIPFSDCPIISEEVFERFVRILLKRLSPLFLNIFNEVKGIVVSEGVKHPLFAGTYLETLANHSTAANFLDF